MNRERFTLELETTNAAFDGAAAEIELATILQRLADRTVDGVLGQGGTVRDSNGNTIGSYVWGER